MSMKGQIEDFIISYKKQLITLFFFLVVFLMVLFFYTLSIAFEIQKISTDIKFLISCDMDAFERFLAMSEQSKKSISEHAIKNKKNFFIDFPKNESISYIRSKVNALIRYSSAIVVFLRKNDESDCCRCMVEAESEEIFRRAKKFVFNDIYLKNMKIRYN